VQIQIYETCSSFEENTARLIFFLEKELINKRNNTNMNVNFPFNNFNDGYFNNKFNIEENENNHMMVNNGMYNNNNFTNNHSFNNNFNINYKHPNSFFKGNFNNNDFGNFMNRNFNMNNNPCLNFNYNNNPDVYNFGDSFKKQNSYENKNHNPTLYNNSAINNGSPIQNNLLSIIRTIFNAF